MATNGKRVTVTDAPTRLSTAPTDRQQGSMVMVKNAGAAAVDLGGEAVTTGAGYELAAGEVSPVLTLGLGESLYAVAAAAGSVPVHVLESGV